MEQVEPSRATDERMLAAILGPQHSIWGSPKTAKFAFNWWCLLNLPLLGEVLPAQIRLCEAEAKGW
jgi:hypothetical protein